MLLKILILAVIAWFVLRAARNLLRAVVHDQMNAHGPIAGQNDSRRPDTGRKTSRSHANERDEQDVEDARFRDL